MSAHTPGPWSVLDGLHGHPETVNAERFDRPICRVHEWDDPSWQAANAQLIAAAPEMLKALKLVFYLWLKEEIRDARDVLVEARAMKSAVITAIAKAEGR